MANCRFCDNKIDNPFLDLGYQPLCNANIKLTKSEIEEKFYPLQVFFCEKCFLVQVAHSVKPKEIYKDYNYFSSFSSSWLDHAKEYSNFIVSKLQLKENAFVVEIASNDGYLLKNFQNLNIPCLGVEPSESVAKTAMKSRIETICSFFDKKLAKFIVAEYSKADLIIANNVFAHVPEINNFTSGIADLLKDEGVCTIEVPYLKNLIEFSQFDTIYHEHFFYYTVSSLKTILLKQNLEIFNIELLSTHGGSLRVYVKHKNSNAKDVQPIVEKMIKEEVKLGMNKIGYYSEFTHKVEKIKNSLLNILTKLKNSNKVLAAYGAPGKGNTLLNSCGINTNLISFTVDKNPAKQNTFLPGSRIPVCDITRLKEEKPDYILILPWNLKNEIILELKFVREWGAKFIIPIPEVKILEAGV